MSRAERKLKVIRVVTSPECVPWHLGNTLKRIPADFEICVVGQGVSKYRDVFPDVGWVDVDICRRINPFRDLKALTALCVLFYQYRPDIVHSIMPKAGLLSAVAGVLTRVPVRIHTFTGQVWLTKAGLSRTFFKLLDRLVVLLNTICLTDSPSQSVFLFSAGISLKGAPLPVLGKGSLIGVDLDRFNLERVSQVSNISRSSLGIADYDFVFAFIARKSLEKGALDVLHAFNQARKSNPNLRLLYVGPDESDGQLAKLRETEGQLFEGVIDIGPVSNHEEYLAISDVLCLPSYREGFGTIVIDAAAMEVPAIGSEIVGLVDSIENGVSGFLFPPGDVGRLSELMEQLSENTGMVECLGKAARKRAQTFYSAQYLYDSLRDLYWSEIHQKSVLEC